MIDPAILLTLQVPFPPEQPTLVEERVLQSTVGAQAERIGRRLADSFDASADAWIGAMERARLSAEHAKVSSVAAEEDIQTLDSLIADFEAMADIRAKRGARAQRQITRDVKATFKVDPSLAAARRAFGARITATEKRVIEALLEYALFLRAVRAEINPASRGGQTFETMDDLERALASLGAA
ncbi:hypothetical protein PUR29_36310 [Methylobacterium ajmalii]|uniref:Uncharacterized protein n=1 Tax=Methylobacterium ajmalii TaxID=2738439 RepID=A0ABV0A7G5_9HYPH